MASIPSSLFLSPSFSISFYLCISSTSIPAGCCPQTGCCWLWDAALGQSSVMIMLELDLLENIHSNILDPCEVHSINK